MKNIIEKTLDSMGGFFLPQKKFILHIFILYVSLKGRVNFMTMGRYGSYYEKSYRLHFKSCFNFTQFNTTLMQETTSEKRHFVIGIDCSFIPKSGKKTKYLGKFWSGASSRALKGLEISSIAAIDMNRNAAYHITTNLTPPSDNSKKKRTEFYLQQIIDNKYHLSTLSKYIVGDGYYVKEPFVSGLLDDTPFHLVSKMRKDANLHYLYKGKRTGKQGAPRKYDGKVICHNPDLRRFEKCYEDDKKIIYSAVVHSVSLKRTIRIAYLMNRADKSYVIFCSTDITLNGYEIWKMYKSRFQIEFLFRDAKQFTGLNNCQARDKEKLEFHFNTSLTAVSLARMEQENCEEEDLPFSMCDINNRYYNDLLIKRFIAMSEIDVTDKKIQAAYQSVTQWGNIAA
jgi:hypothetical protein